MDISINQLKVFRAVAERRNFTRAAEDLYLTQPAVSTVIAKLEQTVGTKLFDQLGKRVYLTPAGVEFLACANRMIALAEETKGRLSDYGQAARGTLAIGASHTIGDYLLPRILGELRRQYPAVTVTVEIGNARHIIGGVLTNRVDIGLVAGEVAHPDLRESRIMSDELVLIVPPTHGWADRTTVSLDELLAEPYIVRERGASVRAMVDEELKRREACLSIVLEMSSNEAVKQAVRAGIGVSIASELTIGEEVRSGSLKALRIDGLSLRRDVHLFHHKDKYLTKVIRDFITQVSTGIIHTGEALSATC